MRVPSRSRSAIPSEGGSTTASGAPEAVSRGLTMVHATLHGPRDVGSVLEPGQVRLPVRDGDVAEGPRALLPDRLPASFRVRTVARFSQAVSYTHLRAHET